MASKPSTAILHYSSAPVVGGVEAVIQAQASVFHDNGFPVSILSGRGEARALPDGVAYHHIPLMDSMNPEISRISADLERGEITDQFDDLTKQIANRLGPILRPFDHVIVHNVLSKHFNLPLTAAIYQLLDQDGIRHLIAWGHDFTWTSSNSMNRVHPGYPWDLLRIYDPRITYVTISRQRQAEWAELLKCPLGKIQIIYNGVSPRELLGLSRAIEGLANRIGLWQADLILLMPVRVTQAKNFEFAMQVVDLLRGYGQRVKLVVSGPPDPHDDASLEYYRKLKNQRAALDLVEEVCFVYESGANPGETFTLDSTETGELFRIADLVLMPSHREGYGMPVLEAGLVGIPVFSTPIPAAVEIGSPDVNIFPEDASAEYVANLILMWAKSDPQHALKRRVRGNYTWRAIFYQSILPLLEIKSVRNAG